MSGSHSDEPDSPEPDEPSAEVPATGETEIYSRAYSAPEAEHFTSGPYLPPEPGLYDYDSYAAADVEAPPPPRWPWVVGVVAIIAAISLVASVVLLVRNSDSEITAEPTSSPTTTAPSTPFQDEFPSTTTPPPPPPTTEEPPPPPPPPSTVTVTQPPPPPPTTEEPPPPPSPTATAAPAPTSTTPAGPKYVTYQVWGTKAPLDRISVTYTDASGHQRTQQNVHGM